MKSEKEEEEEHKKKEVRDIVRHEKIRRKLERKGNQPKQRERKNKKIRIRKRKLYY